MTTAADIRIEEVSREVDELRKAVQRLQEDTMVDELSKAVQRLQDDAMDLRRAFDGTQERRAVPLMLVDAISAVREHTAGRFERLEEMVKRGFDSVSSSQMLIAQNVVGLRNSVSANHSFYAAKLEELGNKIDALVLGMR